MGQREGLSYFDISKISQRYECSKTSGSGLNLGAIASGFFSGSNSINRPIYRPSVRPNLQSSFRPSSSPTRRPTTRPLTNSASNSAFATASNAASSYGFAGREDFNIPNQFKDVFNIYTSPQFWQRFISSWFFPQPQPRLPRQYTYHDYPYSFGQEFYG